MLHYYPCLSHFSFSVSLFLPQRVKKEGKGGGLGAATNHHHHHPPHPTHVSAIINSAAVAPLWFCNAVRDDERSRALSPAHNEAAVNRAINKC